MPELRFVGTGLHECPPKSSKGDYYEAEFTLQQDDIMKLTKFYRSVDYSGRVKDYYNNIYLRKYKLKMWFCQNDLSEDGTVELSSTIDIDHTFIPIVDPDPDRPVSEKDFSERGSSYLHCGFTATGLESFRSGHSGNKQSGNAFQWAGTDSGEDGGVAIPAAIAIGLLGTGAAVAAGAAASGAVAAGAGGASGAAAGTDGGESGEDERKKKRYKMYIQKDFGDAIRKGADPVTVRARIAEVSEDGTERDRNDLTARINSVSGDGMEIHRAASAGRYCEADVSIPEDYEGETADITFTFEGEGGSFNNTVRFRAVGEPKIMFLDKDDAAGRGICEIDAIFGDGFTYVRRFRLEDAVTFPAADAFSAKGPEDIALSFETTETPGIYSVSIANKTSEPDGNDPHWNIFNKKERRAITISVTAEGEREPTTCDVYVSLYPAGISVESRNLQVDDKQPDVRYVVARSYEKDEGSYGGLDSKWQSSEIKFNLAVMENDGAVVNPENADFEAQKIKGANSLTEAIVEKYKYKEKTNKIGDQNVYYFEPNSTLYEDAPGFEGSRMMILLPVSFRYNGKTVDADVQIRLKGIEMDPMEKWEREYEKLRERIQTFSFEEDKEYWLQQLESLAIEPRADVKELRLASKYLVGKYMRYWTRQGEAHMRDVAFYDFMISTLEWTKFFGDCAFSLLISVYAGPLADAVISPAKDFFVGALGEIIAADKFTLDTFDKFEFSKNLAAAGDNILANSISFANYKTALATLGGYFVYSAFKNYIVKWNEEGVSDMWGALVGAFSDMTINVIKIGASALLGKWMSSSDTFQKKIAPTFDKYFKQTYFSNFQAQYNRWQQLYGELALKGASDTATIALSDVLDKYVSELVGEGAGWVSEQIDDLVDAGGFSLRDGSVCYSVVLNFSEDSKCKITIDILKALNYVTCPLTSFLIDLIFGSNMPAAAAPIEIPQDPPLPEDK